MLCLIAGLGWLGSPSHGYYLHEPTSNTSLSHKRTSNDTNQPTEHAYDHIAQLLACVSKAVKHGCECTALLRICPPIPILSLRWLERHMNGPKNARMWAKVDPAEIV